LLEELIKQLDEIKDDQYSKLNLFGPYVEWKTQGGTFANDDHLSPRRATAEFGRYMTLLERLMALTADHQPDIKDPETFFGFLRIKASLALMG
jgi:hypothetical protein